MKSELVDVIAELNEEKALEIVNKALDEGENPLSILSACQEAMAVVGERFEKQEYYLAELMMAGELLKQISEIVKPRLNAAGNDSETKGKIVIGTVHGDVHNIGKDIVIFMLEASGYEVHDLGVDVPEADFVEAIREVQPQVVYLSGLLTSIFPVFLSTIEAIKEAGLRDQVKIAIGGGQVDQKVSDYSGADGYGSVASVAIALASEWIS
jgi:5-methyltetrahydrofolate--homocysteine methyltransferase